MYQLYVYMYMYSVSWYFIYVHLQPLYTTACCYLAPGGGCEVLFSPGLSVCVSVCVSVCACLCVCPANILVFYFSAIRRDIDLKFIQDTYRLVLN